eukprot:scaffold68814_cov72-Phaeocystis_antarctica.AAC.1
MHQRAEQYRSTDGRVLEASPTGGGGLILAGSVQLRFSGFEEGRQGSGVGMTASGRSLVGTPSPTSTPVGAPARRPIYGICKFAFSVAWFTHGNWTFHLNFVKSTEHLVLIEKREVGRQQQPPLPLCALARCGLSAT